jgi:hypothetical protein
MLKVILIVGGSIGLVFSYLFIFALCRAASEADRMEGRDFDDV